MKWGTWGPPDIGCMFCVGGVDARRLCARHGEQLPVAGYALEFVDATVRELVPQPSATMRHNLAIASSLPWGVVDIAQTRDVSKAGLCFVSTQRFSSGEEIYITLPYARSQTPVETKGKVIWTADGASGRFYGVEYQR